MSSEDKTSLFGPSAVFDPTHYEPRAGKSCGMAPTAVDDMVGKDGVGETIMGNCTTTIPLKLDFDGAEARHTVFLGPTGKGMSVMDWQPAPFKRILIELQGTKFSDLADIIQLLDQLKARLQRGDVSGEESDDDFGYRFCVQMAAEGPSIFGEAPSSCS